MPPQQAWASRQFQDCESEGKSRAVQCKWCVEKKVAYNSTSRKNAHLKQCLSFNEHIVQLIEAESAGGYICRELEQVPEGVLEFILVQTGSRRLLSESGTNMQFANRLRASSGTGEAGRVDAREGAPRPETMRPTPRTSSYSNKATVDRAFANAIQDSGMPLNVFNATTHPAMVDTLRLLDKDTRVRIAKELLEEAYEEVKRAVDNYIEKQQYLNSIVGEGDLPDRTALPDRMPNRFRDSMEAL